LYCIFPREFYSYFLLHYKMIVPYMPSLLDYATCCTLAEEHFDVIVVHPRDYSLDVSLVF